MLIIFYVVFDFRYIEYALFIHNHMYTYPRTHKNFYIHTIIIYVSMFLHHTWHIHILCTAGKMFRGRNVALIDQNGRRLISLILFVALSCFVEKVTHTNYNGWIMDSDVDNE